MKRKDHVYLVSGNSKTEDDSMEAILYVGETLTHVWSAKNEDMKPPLKFKFLQMLSCLQIYY